MFRRRAARPMSWSVVVAAPKGPAGEQWGDTWFARDLVDALVALAGFEAGGAAETLAGILGFDPADPPESVPFEATLTLTAD